MALHIGKEIKRVLKEKGRKSKWLAERINTTPRNLYDLLTRSEISTTQLAEISRELEYDFFALYQEQLSHQREQVADSATLTTWERKPGAVQVVVELDGGETTLNVWVEKLNRINKALAA